MNKILIVEDDQYYRETLAKLLEENNYDVVQATDGQEGLDKLQQPYGLVISDIMHPNLDGLQMVERFNATGAEQGEIWYLTNLGSHKEIIQEAKNLGVEKLFDKSMVSPEGMVEKVNIFFQKQSQGNTSELQQKLLGESDMLQYLTQFDHIKMIPEKRYLFIITDDERRKDYASAYIDTRADITNNLEEGIRMMNPEIYKLVYSDQELPEVDKYVFWHQRDFIYIYESTTYRKLRIEKEQKKKDSEDDGTSSKPKTGLIDKVTNIFKLP